VVEVEDGYLSNAVVQLNCGATWHIVAYKAVAQGLHMRYVSACKYQAFMKFVVHTCLSMFSAQASDAAWSVSLLFCIRHHSGSQATIIKIALQGHSLITKLTVYPSQRSRNSI